VSLRAAVVVESLSPSGGIDVAVGHARLLRELEDVDAQLVVAADGDGDVEDRYAGVPVLGLEAARGQRFDVAVATWWTTALVAPELEAASTALLLQSLDERFYPARDAFDRLGAVLALDAVDHVFAVSDHLGRLVGRLRPDRPVHVVRNGVDKAVFAAPSRSGESEGPLRILVEGQPGLWLKGVDDALTATRAMSAPASVTVVSRRPGADPPGADRVLSALSAPEMARLYAETDVMVKLSRFEGLGLPPLEAAHAGVPSIVTPFGGQEDWLRHGANGIEVGFDDLATVTAWLDLLARDRDLLARLGRGALATAAEWPGTEDATRQLAGALRTVAAAPTDPRARARALRRQVDLGREELRRRDVDLDEVRGALRWNKEALEDARTEGRRIYGELDRLNALVGELYADHDRLRLRVDQVEGSRAYRAGEALKRLLRRTS
jgi:glycosyltransferase involved in cell wall biosynthesis